MWIRERLGRFLQSLTWWVLGRCARCGGELERAEGLSLFPPTLCKECGFATDGDGER